MVLLKAPSQLENKHQCKTFVLNLCLPNWTLISMICRTISLAQFVQFFHKQKQKNDTKLCGLTTFRSLFSSLSQMTVWRDPPPLHMFYIIQYHSDSRLLHCAKLFVSKMPVQSWEIKCEWKRCVDYLIGLSKEKHYCWKNVSTNLRNNPKFNTLKSCFKKKWCGNAHLP